MYALSVVSILCALTCTASSTDYNKARSRYDVDQLVTTFMAYRDPPGCLQFCIAMGDPEQRKLALVPRCSNYVHIYLLDGRSKLFDTVRKVYRVCNNCSEKQKRMMSEALECMYSELHTLAMCLPYTPDYEDSEMELVNILREIGRKMGIIDSNGRLNHGNPGKSYYSGQKVCIYFQGKRHLWGLIRYDLLTASLEERAGLIKCLGPLLSLQNLIELNDFASKHGLGECLFEIDQLIYGTRKETNTLFDAPIGTEQYGLGEVFNYDGVREEILERLDWRTLWYAMPYVNKLLNLTVSRKFVIQKCRSLKEHLRTEAEEFEPEYLYNMKHPWNTLFPTVHHLVKYYVGNLNDANIPDAWLRKVFDGIGLFEYNDDIIAKGMEAHGNKCLLKQDQQMKCLVKAANIFLKDPSKYNSGIFGAIEGPKLMQSIAEADKPIELFQYICNKIIHTPNPNTHAITKFLSPILAAEKLDWPVEVIELAQTEISNRCGIAIKLPFTAEQIQSLLPAQLHTLTSTFHNDGSTVLENKIFAAISESDPIVWKAFTFNDYFNVLRVLYTHPKAMDKQQFELFIRRAIESKGDDPDFQRAFVSIFSTIRDFVAH